MQNPELVNECKQRFQRGEKLESILRYLRESGLTKSRSIRVVEHLTGCSRKESKVLVHFSRTWRDRQLTDESLPTMIIGGLTSGSVKGISVTERTSSIDIPRLLAKFDIKMPDAN